MQLWQKCKRWLRQQLEDSPAPLDLSFGPLLEKYHAGQVASAIAIEATMWDGGQGAFWFDPDRYEGDWKQWAARPKPQPPKLEKQRWDRNRAMGQQAELNARAAHAAMQQAATSAAVQQAVGQGITNGQYSNLLAALNQNIHRPPPRPPKVICDCGERTVVYNRNLATMMFLLKCPACGASYEGDYI